MDARQLRSYHSIKATVLLLQEPAFNRPDFAGLRAKLSTAWNTLNGLYTAQQVAHQQQGGDGSEIKRHRTSLLTSIRRISSHAQVILEGMPGIEEDLAVPKANAKHADLIEATGRIVKNLRPHMKTLQRSGLRKSSITEAEGLAKALREKLSSNDTVVSRRSRATSSIPDAIRRARKVVDAVDTAVKKEFARDPVMLLKWNRSKRIPGQIGRPKKRRRKSDSPPESLD